MIITHFNLFKQVPLKSSKMDVLLQQIWPPTHNTISFALWQRKAFIKILQANLSKAIYEVSKQSTYGPISLIRSLKHTQTHTNL